MEQEEWNTVREYHVAVPECVGRRVTSHTLGDGAHR
jgi:hypothetical protein